MNCFTCRLPMKAVMEGHAFSRIVYDLCEKCGGLWLDNGELEKLTVKTPSGLKDGLIEILAETQEAWWQNPGSLKRMHAVRNCPRCPELTMIKMHPFGYETLVLDYCRHCSGIWLDAGEIFKMNDYLKWLDRQSKPAQFGCFLRHIGLRGRRRKPRPAAF